MSGATISTYICIIYEIMQQLGFKRSFSLKVNKANKNYLENFILHHASCGDFKEEIYDTSRRNAQDSQ